MRATGTIAVAALVLFGQLFGMPGAAQRSDSVKELMGKAQSDSERRAVEDLINKLQNRLPPAAAPAPAAPASVPSEATTAGAPAVVVAPPLPPVPAMQTPATAGATPEPAKPAAANDEPAARPPLPAPLPSVVATPSETPPPLATPQTPAATEPKAPINEAPAIAARERLPTVDLEVYFEFASAEISPAAVATLVTLGRTLSDPRLADQTFVIGGYTDGKGKPDYNFRLSQLRADTVRQFLITEFQIEPARLISKGFGKSKFKNAANPLAVENRRVQIINWTNQLKRKP